MLTDISQWKVAPSLHWSEAFAAWLAEDGRKKGGRGKLGRLSIQAYLQDVKHFGRWFEQAQAVGFSFDLMSREVVRAYFDWQDGIHAAPNSRNRRLASLKVFVRFGQESGLLDFDPTDCIERASEESLPPRAKTADEMKALETVLSSGGHLRRKTAKYDFLGMRDMVIFTLAIGAGLRESEIAALQIRNVNFKTKYISLKGKGGHTGHVKVNKETLSVLTAWLKMRPANGESVVCDWKGNGLSRSQIWRRLRDVGLAAEMDLSPHDLRHTFCLGVMRKALKDGLSPESALDAVRRQGRHRDERTAQRYLRATDNDLERIMEAM